MGGGGREGDSSLERQYDRLHVRIQCGIFQVVFMFALQQQSIETQWAIFSLALWSQILDHYSSSQVAPTLIWQSQISVDIVNTHTLGAFWLQYYSV